MMEIWQKLVSQQKNYSVFGKISLSTKIKDNHNRTRQLYKIISDLTGQNDINPLPESHSDQELAEDFAEFFLQKIKAICEKFNNITPDITEPSDVLQLTTFSPVSE